MPDPLTPEIRGDIDVNTRSFARALRAENASPNTVETYMEAITQFSTFLSRNRMPTDIARIRRIHVEAFITGLLERFKPATANNRYRDLRRFFSWLVDEEEIEESPMANMKPPRVPESPPGSRQRWHPQRTHRHGLSGPASTLPASLHSHRFLLAESGGAMVPRVDREVRPTRQLRERPCVGPNHRRIPGSVQRADAAIHLEGLRRSYYRQG